MLEPPTRARNISRSTSRNESGEALPVLLVDEEEKGEKYDYHPHVNNEGNLFYSSNLGYGGKG